MSDRGFRYGQHVFESIAIRHGAALLVADHLSLLSLSARLQGIPCPRSLLAKLRSFFKSVPLADGMLRIYLTAGPGAPGSRITMPGCYLTWEPATFPSAAAIEKGFTLTMIPKAFPGEAWGIKKGNYMPHLEAFDVAREAAAQEGIVCDQRGKILSCAMGNLLVWFPGSDPKKAPILCTPHTSVECVRTGAVLTWVRRQVVVVERELRPDDLRHARALAVTNSRLGVMPVSILDGWKLPDVSLSRTLAHAYLREML